MIIDTTIDALRLYDGSDVDLFYIKDNGAEGIFKYDALDTTSVDNTGTTLVDSEGRRYNRVFNDAIYASWFGASPLTADNAPPIQAAIDFAAYGESSKHSREVILPAGRMNINDVIHLGYGDKYTSVVLTGVSEAFPWDTESPGMQGTALYANFNDRPCINIQGSLNSVVRGVRFIGRNGFWGSNPYGQEMLDPENYARPDTMGPNSDSRYAPYAGISIDGYRGAYGIQPTPSYPNPDYPSWVNGSGKPANWYKIQSSSITIENCRIEGFIVGIVTEPSGGDGNGDFIKNRQLHGL